MGISRIYPYDGPVYRYTCDKCGGVYTTEDKRIPYDWDCVTVRTGTELTQIETEFYLCKHCSMLFLEKMSSFIDGE